MKTETLGHRKAKKYFYENWSVKTSAKQKSILPKTETFSSEYFFVLLSKWMLIGD